MKRIKSLLSGLLIVGMSAMVVAGCGAKDDTPAPGGNETPGNGQTETPDDFKLVLRLSHVFSPEEQLTKSMDLVAERILEKTNGAIEIQTFPQAQLAVYKDGLEQVVRGSDFISVEDPSYLGDYVPDFKALVGPMLYSEFDQYTEMIKTDLVKDMIDRAEDAGIKILALDFIFGFRNIITNRIIVEPEDLRGVKLRTPGSQLFIDSINAMGGAATPLPWAETLSAVQQGVVDGLEGSEFTNIANKVYEIASNVALTKHFLGTAGAYISTDVWAKIPAEYQTIIEEEFRYGAEEMIQIVSESYDATVAELKELGVEFNEVNLEAFTAATKPVYENMEGVTPGIYDLLLDELDKMK